MAKTAGIPRTQDSKFEIAGLQTLAASLQYKAINFAQLVDTITANSRYADARQRYVLTDAAAQTRYPNLGALYLAAGESPITHTV